MKQLERALLRDTRQGFDLLVTGSLPLNPSEFLSTGETTELVQALSDNYDHVIIDTPPVMLVTDATILSRYVDGVIVVARVGQTSKQGLQQSISELEKVGANILGVSRHGICRTEHGGFAESAAQGACAGYFPAEACGNTAAPTNFDVNTQCFDTGIVEAVVRRALAVNPEASIIIKSTVPVGYTEALRRQLGYRWIF